MVIKNLTNYNIARQQEEKEEIKAVPEQEETKNLEMMLQEKCDLEENHAEETLFKKIAFDPGKKISTLNVIPVHGRPKNES